MKTITIKKGHYLPEIIIFAFAAFTRFFRLNIPDKHYFDEVYHVFTAQEMFKGTPAAWEWWNANPQGFAWEWTHPPLAKEFMVLAISIFGDNAFAWRFFSAFFGVGVIILIYLLANKLFKNRMIALLAAFIASMDGLLLSMSRIGMNDMYFLFFLLLAFLLFLYDRRLLTGVALGLAISSKWTGVFGILIIGLIYLAQKFINFERKRIKTKQFIRDLLFAPLFLIIIPITIYLASYLPFFTGKHVPQGTNYTIGQTFKELQQQMYWYHTSLKAEHSYQSKPIQWVFNLRPVWLYVDYKDEEVANIYTLGNPVFMWIGLAGIIYLVFEFIKKKSLGVGIVLLGYFGFFVPWIFSPRIMFHYHYLASTAFLAIALGFMFVKIKSAKLGPLALKLFLGVLILSFIYFFPLWTGIHVPKNLANSYFWISSWK